MLYIILAIGIALLYFAFFGNKTKKADVPAKPFFDTTQNSLNRRTKQ
jgi:hypothetical protein